MAHKMAEDENQGYDESRFEVDVSQNFHCPICLNILKEPVQCQNNEHYFCTTCITRHLRNYETCPTCMEKLTLETTRRAPRIVTDYLSELKISCNYAERGCREFVPLESLEAHTKDCGFCPVECSNDGCNVVMNKQDRRHHETKLCGFRVEACHDCIEMRYDIDEMKTSLTEMKTQLQYGLNKMQGDTRRELNQLRKNFTEVTQQLEEMRLTQQRILSQRDKQMAEMRAEVKRLTVGQREIVPYNKEEVIVISGGFTDSSGKPLNSAEMFSLSKRRWVPLKPMTKRRAEAWSVVHRNQVIVTGGWTPENATSTLEALDTQHIPHSLWLNYPTELPHTSFAHRCVVAGDRMIWTGGWNPDEKKCFDSIHEVALAPPYTSNQVSNMPQARCLHSAELIENKLFICGGTTTNDPKDSIDSVLEYCVDDYTKPKQRRALMFPVCAMATVVWRDNVILLGGSDKNSQSLNTVLMYNTTTGESNVLPHMKYSRDACSAVVIRNFIVVMGGCDEKKQVLNSVEYFDFDRYSWEELSPMIEARSSASAVVVTSSCLTSSC